tara:strand:- start:361 stop:945 length:585 start_codon:yes stop_codon:yes gene_type:complete
VESETPMAVNKNFVVKNGLEVNDNLLIADTNSQKVGIGTSVSSYTLHVLGGIGATESYVTGVGTFLSDVYIGGNLNVTGDVVYDEVSGRNLNITGIATINQLNVTDLNVSGITTVGVVTGAGAIYYGDGSNLTGNAPGLTAAIGIQSAGNRIGAGITFLNIVGTGFTADATGQEANLYLPPPGVSLGLAIALGG